MTPAGRILEPLRYMLCTTTAAFVLCDYISFTYHALMGNLVVRANFLDLTQDLLPGPRLVITTKALVSCAPETIF